MARKKKIHPSLRIDNNDEDADEDIFIGGLEHGSSFEASAYAENQDDDDDDEYEDEEDEDDDPMAAINKRMNALEQENAALRRAIPPVQSRQAPAPEPEEEPNWDELIFTDPGRALAMRDEKLRKQITSELRGEYNREQSTTRFWNDFYKANDDIDRESDHDIVNATLQSNLSTLADLPTDAAIVKLGDLTRQRIMRYSKQSGGKRVRRMAEGASAPTPGKVKKSAENKITSISDLIKARKQKRVSAA